MDEIKRLSNLASKEEVIERVNEIIDLLTDTDEYEYDDEADDDNDE